MKPVLLRVFGTLAVLAALITVTLAVASAQDRYVAVSDIYCYAFGDADGNRKVDTEDARAVLRCALGLEALPAETERFCDMNKYEGIDTEDARKVLRIALELDRPRKHKNKKLVTTQEPTCSDPGISAHICAYCNEYYDFGLIPEKPHTALGWEIVREPTCSKAGVKKQYCVYCGECIEKETIPKTEHIYGPMQFKSDTPDCTRAQEVYQVCVNCGYTKEWISLGMEHTFTWVTVKEPTCTKSGKQEEVCSVCGKKSGNTQKLPSYGGHTPSGWVIVTYPTTKSEGLQRILCTRCGKILQEEVLPIKEPQ